MISFLPNRMGQEVIMQVFQVWSINPSMGDYFFLCILVVRKQTNKQTLRTQRRKVTHKAKGKEGSELLPRAITPLSADPRNMEAWIKEEAHCIILLKFWDY